MVAVDVVGAVLVFGLLVLSTAMAVLGLLGITGAVRFRRCQSCTHLVPTSSAQVSACIYCRHSRLGRAFLVGYPWRQQSGTTVRSTPYGDGNVVVHGTDYEPAQERA
jgi:hypothetical protein